MVHISRLSEELILWMSQTLASSTSPTGSAPAVPSCRRRKPDVPELARGKTAAWSVT